MKLVRDRVADRIKSEDETKISVVCNNQEFFDFLKLKLAEELTELKNSKYSDPEEYADVLEVLETLMEIKGFDLYTILKIKHDKQAKEGSLRGGNIYKIKK